MQEIIALRIARWWRCFRRRDCRTLLSAAMAAMLMVPLVNGAQPSAATRKMAAQTNAPAAHRRVAARKRKSTRQETAVAAMPAQTPAPPPAPPQPQWPVNDPPKEASIAWNAQGLSIDAQNSSLEQILDEIVKQTGVKVEGMDKDERVFGVYGPGQPRDVLAQLLEGTDYNILMVGAGERGAPQEIVLSQKPTGGAQPNAPVAQSDMYEPPAYEPPQSLEPHPQAIPPNQGPRTPQQILQEMQQRQLLMQQQQQMQLERQQQQQQ
jgi:hypothetical protein